MAGTLAPRESAGDHWEIVRELVDDIVLVSDDDMREGRMAVDRASASRELSGAATLAALLNGQG